MRESASIRLTKLLGMGIAVFFLAIFGNAPAYAATFTRAIETTIEPKSGSEVKVTQTQRLTWDNPRVYFPASKNYAYVYIFPAYENQLATLQQRVRNISVHSSAAASDAIKFTTSISEGALQVKIPYYENLSNDNELEFTVSYTTDLYVLSEGGIVEIAYPGLSDNFSSKVAHEREGYDEVTTYSLSFTLPSKLGEVASIYPKPVTQKTVNKQTVVTYGVTALVGKSVKIVLGKERLVKFTLSGSTYATNENTPEFVKNLLVNYVDVALPTQQLSTEFSNQIIYYSKIDPFPTKVWVDGEGNLIARLPVSAAEGGKIAIEGYAIIRRGESVTSLPNRPVSEISSTMSAYLKEEPLFWQVTNSEIQAAAKEISKTDGPELSTVRQTLSYVSQKISYAQEVKEADLQRLGAVGALNKKVGVCMEYSDLLITLLRAKGIPARAVYGDGVGSRVERTLEGVGHQWVGVWFPERGWIPVDPTWSDGGQEYIGHDFNHLVWYVASISANEPSGFNCRTWDASSPCKEALRIDTVPVAILPPVEQLMSITQLQEKVNSRSTETSSNVFVQAAQNVVSFLGESKSGRILLSKQGMLITFALILYLLLVAVVSMVSKIVRRAKKTVKN